MRLNGPGYLRAFLLVASHQAQRQISLRGHGFDDEVDARGFDECESFFGVLINIPERVATEETYRDQSTMRIGGERKVSSCQRHFQAALHEELSGPDWPDPRR